MLSGPGGLYGHDHFPYAVEEVFDALHFGFLLILHSATKYCIVSPGIYAVVHNHSWFLLILG